MQKEDKMQNLTYKKNFRDNLPHLQPKGAIMAITFRLAFSLPKNIIEKLRLYKNDYDDKIRLLKDDALKVYKSEFEKQYFEYFDNFIDTHHREINWLKNKQIAKTVAEAIHYLDNKKYELYCYCIMPNHVHLIIKPLRKGESYYSISEILHSLKGFTAKKCNKILDREGVFWQHGHYDHAIRDEADFAHQTFYIIHNPVKSGLVKNWNEWEFTYLKM